MSFLVYKCSDRGAKSKFIPSELTPAGEWYISSGDQQPKLFQRNVWAFLVVDRAF
jgi:hypothetical protein